MEGHNCGTGREGLRVMRAKPVDLTPRGGTTERGCGGRGERGGGSRVRYAANVTPTKN